MSASFLVNGRSTPLAKIVSILDYVNEKEVAGELELDDFMKDSCNYRSYNFRIDIRDRLKENGWLGYSHGEYYIRMPGRKATQGFAQVLPNHARPARYRAP
jgi:hypothetical protein